MKAFRTAVIVVCVGALVATVAALGKALIDLDSRSTANAALDYADRHIAGGNGVVGRQALAYQARAWIPEADTYVVVVGSELGGVSELTPLYAADFLRYFLFPRRQDADARWVICYGCVRSQLKRPSEVIFDAGDGMSLQRLR